MKRAAETSEQTPAYVLRLGARGSAGGAAEVVFPALEDALLAVGRQVDAAPLDGAAAAQPQPLEIICRRPDGRRRLWRRPRRQFYVDVRAVGRGGDGTEMSPWWGMGTAAEQLLNLHKAGQIRLDDGHRIRLTHREVFSATSLERWKGVKENIAKLVFLTMTLLLVLPMLAIFAHLLLKAWPALSLSFLLENPRDNMTAGGIWAPWWEHSFWCSSRWRWRRPWAYWPASISTNMPPITGSRGSSTWRVVNLAGVPSIVHALFGVGAFVLFAGMGCSLLAASCTLAVMTLPVIITSTREALAAVPMAFREACWNLGALRWQTIRTIVLPNSLSGILTGVILQVSRPPGKRRPSCLPASFSSLPCPTTAGDRSSPTVCATSCMALSYHLFTLSAASPIGVSEGVQYGTAVVLIGLVLAVNSLSIGLRVYLRSRKKW